MRIKIANKLLAFSHLPGTKTILLGTDLLLQIYPTKLISNDFTLSIAFDGPCIDFTVANDFEKGKITVFGKINAGFFRYSIFLAEDSLIGIKIEKDDSKTLQMDVQATSSLKISKFDKYITIEYPSIIKSALEKLSLGNHKKQDMSLVQRRADLKEILPLWFMAGQWKTCCSTVSNSNTLLGNVENAIKNEARDQIYDPFLYLYKAAFSGIFAPRVLDEDFQGFPLPPIHEKSPFVLLHEGMKLIRSLFVRSEDNKLFLLPKLPSEFACGRMIDVIAFNGALHLSFEWTKFKLFKVILRGLKKCEFQLHLQSEIKTFRTRSSLAEKGITVDRNAAISIEIGQSLYLDRFFQ